MGKPPDLFRGIIQIAGFHDLQEANLAISLGADILGIPLGLTVNKEDCNVPTAKSISRTFPDRVCLITYLSTADEILNLSSQIEAAWVQVHGEITIEELKRLRAICPHKRLIKSLVVGKSTLSQLENQMLAMESYVDAFITDTYNPSTGADGATGLTHDWQITRNLIARSRRPIILAGGLSPDNVSRAILEACPFGVDSHTGVEDSNGRKCPVRLKAFIDSSKVAFGRY